MCLPAESRRKESGLKYIAGMKQDFRFKAFAIPGIFAVLLILRIALAFIVNQTFEKGFLDINKADPVTYLLGAKSILSAGANPFTFFPPLQFLFVAGFLFLGGGNVVVPLLATACIEWLTIVVLYAIALNIFDKKTALVSALIAGCYPWFIYHGLTFYSEALAVFWITIAFYLLLKYFSGQSPYCLVLGGMCWGLASQTRGGLIYFSLVVALVVACALGKRNYKKTTITAILFPAAAFGAFLAIALAVRPIHDNAGLDSKNGVASIIIGANPITTSSEDFGNIQGNIYYAIEHHDTWPDHILAVPQNIDHMSTFHIMRLVMGSVKNDPTRYIWNCFLKLSNFWAPTDDTIYLLKMKLHTSSPHLTQTLSCMLGLTSAVVLLGGLTGLFLSRDIFSIAVVGFVLYYCLLIFVTVGNARLRMPVMPFFVIYCASFLTCFSQQASIAKYLVRKKIFLLLVVCLLANSMYKFREILLSPAEAHIRKIELCSALGFHKATVALIKDAPVVELSEQQRQRLSRAEANASNAVFSLD